MRRRWDIACVVLYNNLRIVPMQLLISFFIWSTWKTFKGILFTHTHTQMIARAHTHTRARARSHARVPVQTHYKYKYEFYTKYGL